MSTSALPPSFVCHWKICAWAMVAAICAHPFMCVVSDVDCQGVCTLCEVDPNTDIAADLGTECCIMFVYNGMLCNLQNCNDSSDRGATRALLQHL